MLIMTAFSISLLRRILVWIFLFLLPTQLGTYFFMDFSYINGVRVDYLAPAVYLTDVIFGILAVWYWRHIWQHIRAHRGIYWVLISLTLVCIAFTTYPLWALYSALKFVQVVFLYVIFSSVHVPAKDILTALGSSAVVQLILTLMQFSQKSSMQGVFYYLGERFMTLTTPGIAKASFFGEQILRPYGTFSHPNSLGGFFLLIYSFILLLPSKSVLKSVVLGLCAMLVLISFSKLAIFTFVLINIGYFIFHYSKKCSLCTISRFTLLLVVAAIFLSTQADPLSFEKRVTLFTQGLSVLRDNPLLGTGFGHHLYAQAKFPSTYSYFFLQPVHNIFILFAMQAGLILTGAVVFLGWNHLKKNHKQIRKYGGYMILVLILTGSGDHYWLTLQQNLLLLGVVWGLMIGQKGVASKDIPQPNRGQ